MESSFKKGRRLEEEIAEAYGKRQPGSGCISVAKEDVTGLKEFSQFLFQTKNAEGNKSFSVKRQDLINLRQNSFKVGKIGLFILRFEEREQYVILRRTDFDHLFGELNEST